MQYTQSHLLHDEKIIHSVQPHWIVFGPSVIIAIFSFIMSGYLKTSLSAFSQFHFLGLPLYTLTTLFILLFALFHALKALIFYKASEYTITNKRILMKTGWIQRRSVEIFLEKTEAIYVDQTVTGRLFGYGTIVVVGTGGTKDPFLYVPDPLKFRACAQQQIDSNEVSRRA
jgi:uncharacterized membrane protein YdbT with pleckstrin-like domain